MERNKHINLGVLIYNNSYYKGASSNIGDYVQSLAAINIYRQIIQEFNNTEYNIKEFVDYLSKVERFAVSLGFKLDLKHYGY